MNEAELTGMPPSASAIGNLVCEIEIIGGSLVLTARLSSVFFIVYTRGLLWAFYCQG